jgi:predicted secreted protein
VNQDLNMPIQDQRSNRIIVCAHCILNQNARVLGLASYPATIPEITDFLQKNKIGILQLPCPELIFSGVNRPRKTKDEYDTNDYRRVCKQIAKSTADQINEYLTNQVEIIGIIGIKNSPTCSVGTQPIEIGILMEELISIIEKCKIRLPVHNLNIKKTSKTIKWLTKII